MQLLGVLAEARPYQQALVLSEEARIVSGNSTSTPAPAAATAGWALAITSASWGTMSVPLRDTMIVPNLQCRSSKLPHWPTSECDIASCGNTGIQLWKSFSKYSGGGLDVSAQGCDFLVSSHWQVFVFGKVFERFKRTAEAFIYFVYGFKWTYCISFMKFACISMRRRLVAAVDLLNLFCLMLV